MELLFDPGDISAPKGTKPWCRGVFGMARSEKRDGQFAVSSLKRTLRMLKDGDHFLLLEDSDRRPFVTWEDFIQYREPFGLGMRVDVVNAIMSEKDETRLLKDVIDSVPALPDAAPPGERGKMGGRGNKAISNRNGFPASGTGRSYLAARLKRDAPEIAARISEFPSMRAAAREAGIVRELTRMEKIQREWKGASRQDREQIFAWINEQMSPSRSAAR